MSGPAGGGESSPHVYDIIGGFRVGQRRWVGVRAPLLRLVQPHQGEVRTKLVSDETAAVLTKS